jgi:hypothetical protein
MRRSAVMAVVALGGAGVTIAALLGAFSSSLGTYGAIFVVGRDGRGLTRLTHDPRLHDYAWSPDGRWIAMATRSVNGHGIEMPGPGRLAADRFGGDLHMQGDVVSLAHGAQRSGRSGSRRTGPCVPQVGLASKVDEHAVCRRQRAAHSL